MSLSAQTGNDWTMCELEVLASLAARMMNTRVAAPNTGGCQTTRIVMTTPQHNAIFGSLSRLLPLRGAPIETETG
jgi:hypothetical protein